MVERIAVLAAALVVAWFVVWTIVLLASLGVEKIEHIADARSRKRRPW